MQTKTLSILESITQTVAGFVISLGIQLLIYPALNIQVTLSQNITITSIFTLASIGRGYVIRRIFNKK